MCRPREVDSQDDNLLNHVKILQLIHSFHKNIWLFQINKKNRFPCWGMAFHILDRIPLRNFGNPTKEAVE